MVTTQQAAPEVLQYWGGRCLPSTRGTVVLVCTETLHFELSTIFHRFFPVISFLSFSLVKFHRYFNLIIAKIRGVFPFSISLARSLSLSLSRERVACHASRSPLERGEDDNTGATHFAFHRFFSTHMHIHIVTS